MNSYKNGMNKHTLACKSEALATGFNLRKELGTGDNGISVIFKHLNDGNYYKCAFKEGNYSKVNMFF